MTDWVREHDMGRGCAGCFLIAVAVVLLIGLIPYIVEAFR